MLKVSQGLATDDDDDNIYVCNAGSKSKKFDSKGTCLCSIGKEMLDIKILQRVAVNYYELRPN